MYFISAITLPTKSHVSMAGILILFLGVSNRVVPLIEWTSIIRVGVVDCVRERNASVGQEFQPNTRLLEAME